MAIPAVPVIGDLPPAPTRSDGPADFTPKADTMIGALQPLVVQVNIALQWMSGRLTDTQAAQAAAAASATAAADSAILAGQKVGLAADQVGLATTQANNAAASASSAQVSAAAAGAAAGLPSLASHSGEVLTVDTNELGVSWQKGLPPLAGNDGKTLQVAAGGVEPAWVMLGRMHAVDEKPSGIGGGASVVGSYVTRELNTVRSNTIAGASLSANKVTLPPGRYRIRGIPGIGDYGVRNKSRLVNDTSGSVLAFGVSSAGPASEVCVEIILSIASAIHLEHRLSANGSANLGAALSYGDVEVYSQLIIEKVE